MPCGLWNEPVDIPFGAIESRQIHGPDEAIMALIDRWPNRRGPAYVKALTACRAAIAGRLDPEAAKPDFLAAVREVELS
ncbi:DUF982 domain-containing protein [Rhizobium grahamii]|nr:hypothetical protein RGCCGE502_17555 [Rhizobium grahamii CCGE 502]